MSDAAPAAVDYGVVSGYGPGIILQRMALGSPERVAIVDGGRRLRWGELAAAATSSATELRSLDPGSLVTVLEGDQSRALATGIVGEWAVWLSGNAVDVQRGPRFADPGSRIEVCVADALENAHAEATSWRHAVFNPAPAETAAVRYAPDGVYQKGHLVWSHRELARLWAVLAPPAESSTLADNTNELLRWATIHSTLLARGRVVNAGQSWVRRLQAVDDRGVEVIHLAAEDVPTLLDAGAGRTCDSAHQVTIWAKFNQWADELLQLQTVFPRAAVRRCLYASWGPYAIATLRELRARGMDWVGRPTLGVSLARDRPEAAWGELKVRSLFTPIFHPNHLPPIELHPQSLSTGLNVRGSSTDGYFTEPPVG